MAQLTEELNDRFAPHGNHLAPDVMGELQSILRLHSFSSQELFYKWESYNIKMGGEDIKFDLRTARDFKKDILDVLERETRGKMHVRSTDKKGTGAVPRSSKANNSDMFGMMEGIVPTTPRLPMNGVNGNSVKRRNNFETPAAKSSKAHATNSPTEAKTPHNFNKVNGPATRPIPFSERLDAGKIVESLNAHITRSEPPMAPFAEARIKLKANTDLAKFSYKPMAMKLSGASEILDDRIDEFLNLVQIHHGLEDSAFGNPASQSTSEIVAIGRIASDTSESRLNPASIVLETSRRTGAGLRIHLKLDGVPGYDFFPGKIVALRGINVSGECFTVSQVLDVPLLPAAASQIADVDTINSRLLCGGSDSGELPLPLNIIVSSGPYTADTDLDFEPLQALCDHAINTKADALILLGPFLDIEHPLIASGDIPPLPMSIHNNPDTATLTDVFRALVCIPLVRLAQSLPNITIILVPSVRDAVNKHVSWPQDRMARRELGLPKQVSIVTNPVTLSLNEFVVAISSQDVLYQLRREECVGGTLPSEDHNLLARLSKHVIEQRHFFPLFPPTARQNLPRSGAIEGVDDGDESAERQPTGAMLDISYLALGEWPNVRPDVLITPSALAPFAKVVQSVVVINPGPLSKKRGPGTFAHMAVGASRVSDEEREEGKFVSHKVFERARVDIMRI